MQSLAQLLINLVFLGIFPSLIKHAWTKHQRSSLGFCRLPVSVDKVFFFLFWNFLGDI